MAKPRVFISSTYYDLKHIRSSIDNFIEGLGFESILSEKGDIAYSPDSPLDESCYREAETADIFVLIIGGRYGSEASTEEKKPSRKFFDRYDSITQKEYESAIKRDIPAYILMESNVYSEYQTFLRNKENKKIHYAHVDSVNIFRLVEEILSKPKNNPLHTFDRFSDIEYWLKEQWAGLFRELLHRMSDQQQIATLSSEVELLSNINGTLQRYLEEIIIKISPNSADQLIETERKRVSELEIDSLIKRNIYFVAVIGIDTDMEKFKVALRKSSSYEEFADKYLELTEDKKITEQIQRHNSSQPIEDINKIREALGLSGFELIKES